MEKLANGYANGSAANGMDDGLTHDQILQLNLDLKNSKDNEKSNKYHGDQLIGVCIMIVESAATELLRTKSWHVQES